MTGKTEFILTRLIRGYKTSAKSWIIQKGFRWEALLVNLEQFLFDDQEGGEAKETGQAQQRANGRKE